jgi:hypothetical protein
VANRNSLPEVFVVSPDPLKPAGLGLVTKPFTPQAALVKGAVVAFCDSSTSAECPGHLLWNVIMAMRTTAASAALRAAFEADRQANVRQSALFLAVRDVGLAPGSSDVLHLCWPRLDAVAKGGGAGELVAVSGSPAVPRGLFDGGKIQALDLGRVLAKPAPRTFSGRLVFVGSVQVLPRTNEADILCPRVAPVGEWLSQSLNWDEVDTIGRYKPLVIVKDIPGLILPLLTDFANSQSSGKPQRYPLVVAVWVGDHDMEQGVSVVEIQICVKQATDLILSFGAWPLLLTVPALTEKAAAARPDVQKKRWLFADWMRGLQAPDAQVIKAVKAQSPMILVCDPFRDTSDPVSALLHNDLADWSGGCLNTHGAAVVGTVLSKKLSALFSQKR